MVVCSHHSSTQELKEQPTTMPQKLAHSILFIYSVRRFFPPNVGCSVCVRFVCCNVSAALTCSLVLLPVSPIGEIIYRSLLTKRQKFKLNAHFKTVSSISFLGNTTDRLIHNWNGEQTIQNECSQHGQYHQSQIVYVR